MQIEINRSALSLAREGLVAIRDGQGTRIVCHAGSLWITQECEVKDAVITAGRIVHRRQSRVDAANRTERFRTAPSLSRRIVRISGCGVGLQDRRANRKANPPLARETETFRMPVAKIHVLEGRYDERRLTKVSEAIQEALISILKIPADDFYQIIHVLPRNRFLHTPSFLGLKYSDDLILLEITFISGRPKETRLALLKELNQRIVAGAGISPDDLLISLYEIAGENVSFGQGLAQRAFISQTA